ncbi:MAG: hypothetical protein ACLFP2_04220 [Candidatus Woesearchaeota archaeon]
MYNRPPTMVPPPGSCPINGPKPMDYHGELRRMDEMRRDDPVYQAMRDPLQKWLDESNQYISIYKK